MITKRSLVALSQLPASTSRFAAARPDGVRSRIGRPTDARGVPARAPGQGAQAWSARTASYARAVGAFVPGLTRKSFEKYGFSTATLLTDWSVIAGPDLASFTLPERLKWPRRVEAYEETGAEQRGRPGATLVLRVDGPRAIEVQYQAAAIIERINAHFGYRAVSDVRFLQAPLPEAKRAGATLRQGPGGNIAPRRADRPADVVGKALAAQPDGGAPDALAAALERLQENMARANRRTD